MNDAPVQTTNYVADPGRIADLARRIREGELSPADLVRRCLERMKAVEGVLQAWCDVMETDALAEAERLGEEAQRGQIRGPLHGIPVGVKDIIDVATRQTRAGSLSRADVAPSSTDAEVVAASRAAGAVILGKTHTTEFAYFDPGPTRNPHNPDHTPGGSSSGSGAAVAAGMVPLALGTQTAGSLNRPAAYCGIAAFKPSTGLLSTFGVVPLAASFDTVGPFGYTVEDAVTYFEALCPGHARFRPENGAGQSGYRVVVLEDPILAEADAEVLAAVDRVVQRLTDAGHGVRRAPSPAPFKKLAANHKTVMEYEIGRAQKVLLDEPANLIGERLRATIMDGGRILDVAYLDARNALAAAQTRFWSAFAGVDAVVFPATPAPAPRGIHATGDPGYILPWTVLGGPVVTLPAGAARSGLPVAVLLAGAPGSDLAFGRIACRLAAAAEG
ncbi:MAG: amidase [Rhodothermales bacterium]